jgi:beta-glucosidase
MSFAKDFMWGAATAAYQIEGAWDADGKGESIWDRHCHRPGATESGDMACDHYRRYLEDVGMMAKMGLKAYRFSLSWPRVLPTGTGAVEQRGIDFYKRLADALLERDITPFVTLFHWDLPVTLWDKYQGFMSRETSKRFADYADIVFRALGDRVTNWITHNEPRVHVSGYASSGGCPGLGGGQKAATVAEHHILLSHALAVQAFRDGGYKGQIGITLSMGDVDPLSGSNADQQAAADAIDHDVYWNLEAIYHGMYPRSLCDRPEVSALLPEGWKEDCATIHGAASDFIGVNHYRINWAESDSASPFGYRFVYDKRVPAREVTGLGWPVVPEGMYRTLMLLKKRYGETPIYVTENGYADSIPASEPPKPNDPERISFLERYMGQAKRAVSEGVNLKGYFVWSLLDNFEWGHYDPRFGLIAVDYATQTRILKDSAKWYRDVIASNGSAL